MYDNILNCKSTKNLKEGDVVVLGSLSGI